MEAEKKYAVYLQSDDQYWDQSMASGPYCVVQIGDLVAREGYHCEEHIQFAHEFSYIVSGSAEFVCDNERIAVHEGDVIFNPLGSLHDIYCRQSDDVRYQYIGFEMTDTADPTDHALFCYLQNTGWRKAKASPAVVSAFEDILLERFIHDPFQKKMTEDALRKLIVSAKRCFERTELGEEGEHDQAEINMLILQICTFIDNNCRDIRVLKTLPKTFGYSYAHLSFLFSRYFGTPLQTYLLRRRHDMEAALLRQGLSVTAVADQMGYSSIHAFSHAFRRYTGLSPKEYAAAAAKGEADEEGGSAAADGPQDGKEDSMGASKGSEHDERQTDDR